MRPKQRRVAKAEDEGSELDAEAGTTPPETVRRGPVRPGGRPAPDLSRKRLSAAASQEAEMAALEAEEAPDLPEAAGAANQGYGRQRESTLPTFLPNRAQNLLADVSERTDTDKMERRVFRFGVFSSIVLLAGAVLAIVSVTIFFRAKSGPPKAIEAPARTTDRLGRGELNEKVGYAQGVAKAFFDAKTVDQKRPLIFGAGREAAFERHYALLGTKEAGQPQLERIKALETGSTIALLVPVQYPNGDMRTAAVVEKSDGFFLDWRSVVTPVTMLWADFLVQKPEAPQLFRVRLMGSESGEASAPLPGGWRAFRVQHGNVEPVSAAALAGSRIATELEQQLAASPGKAIWLDLYLQFQPQRADKRVTIIGSVPEKWTF